MINFLVWILFGLVAGAIAKLIMPGKENLGWVKTILLGVAGSFVGGYIGQLLELGVGGNSFSLINLASAIAGALLLLYAYNLITKK